MKLFWKIAVTVYLIEVACLIPSQIRYIQAATQKLKEQ
jgi:hypothetical protein